MKEKNYKNWKRADLKGHMIKVIKRLYPSLCRHLIKETVESIMREKFPLCLPFTVPDDKGILNLFVAALRHEQSDYEERCENISQKNRRQVRKKSKKEILDMLENFRKPKPVPVQNKQDAFPKDFGKCELGALMDAAIDSPTS